MPPMAPNAPSQKPADPILYSFPSGDDLSKALADFVIKVSKCPLRRRKLVRLFSPADTFGMQAQNEAIDRRNKFTLATSGGSLPKILAKYLVERDDNAVRWDKW